MSERESVVYLCFVLIEVKRDLVNRQMRPTIWQMRPTTIGSPTMSCLDRGQSRSLLLL
jgi:hypothetical protein